MAISRTPARGGNRFVYKPRSAETVHNRMQQYQNGNRDNYIEGNVEGFTPAEGDNWVRLLPPTWNDPQHWAFDMYIHYDVGPDKASYLCIEKMYDAMAAAGFPIPDELLTDGIPLCAMCEELRRAQRAGEKEYGRALESNLRLAAWIINRKEEAQGPKLWQYPITNDREFIAQATDRRTGEVANIDDPENGYDIDFHRKGKAMQTKYSGFKLARQPSPVDQKFVDFVVENPIPKLLKFYPYDHIMGIFAGPSAADRAAEAAQAAGAARTAAAGHDASPPDEDDKIPHEAPPQKPATSTRRSPLVTPKEDPKPAETPAPAAANNNARRRQAVTAKSKAPAAPDFAAWDINGQLDWASAFGIVVPDDVTDAQIPEFLTEQFAQLTADQQAEASKWQPAAEG